MLMGLSMESINTRNDIDAKISAIKSEKRRIENQLEGVKKEIKWYEVKLKKAVKQKNEALKEKIQTIIADLQLKLSHHEDDLIVFNKNYGIDEIKKLAEEKKQILVDLKQVEHRKQMQRQENVNQEVILGYNSKRQKFVDVIKATVQRIDDALPKLKDETGKADLLKFFNSINDDLPNPTPIDVKAATSAALLKDFCQSYLIAAASNKSTILQNRDIIARFKVTLEKCKAYLNCVEIHSEFGVVQYSNHSNSLTMAEIYVDELQHILDFKDESVIESKLYDYLVDTLDQITQEGLLSENECTRIKHNLNPKLLNQYEQLLDFDFDEFGNSVQNSITSARRYYRKEGHIPHEFKAHLLSSFEHEIVKQDSSIIPLSHDFYKFFNDNDQFDLVSILSSILALNNRYSGINVKVAFTLQSKQPESFALKQRIFDFGEHIANKYFYGLFITKLNQSQRLSQKYLQVFFDYIRLIREKTSIHSLTSYYLDHFTKSMYWFVLNGSSYGGVPLYNHGSIQSVADRVLLQQGVTTNQLVKYGIAPTVEYARLLQDEYSTSFLLNHIDLRFKNITEKFDSLEKYKEHIKDLAIDLREMRRLLVKNFKAADTIIDLELPISANESLAIGATGGKLYALWQWETFGDGLGRICIGYNREDMLVQASKPSRLDATYNRVLRVNWDGLISALDTPWLDFTKMGLVGVEVVEDFNLYVLQRFHSMFMEWYSEASRKVKMQMVSIEAEPESNSSDSAVQFDQQDFDQICIQETLNKKFSKDYEATETARNNEKATVITEAKISKTLFNRGIKSNKFFKILEQSFGVVVQQGKGSEIKVSRLSEGGKIFRLGHHGAEVEYHATFVRNVLKRLNIGLDEWCNALIDV